MFVTRRGVLHGATAVVTGIGLAGVAAGDASAKIAPNLVGYQPQPHAGHDCSGCKLFLAPNACKTVDGFISPTGWCKMWIKA